MSISHLRRLALPAAGLLGLALAGCGTGADAVAQRDYAPADGLLGTLGDLRVQNVLVVAPEEPGGTGVLSMVVADRGGAGDELVAVQVDQTEAQVDGETEVPPGGMLTVGGPDADAQVLVEGLGAPAGASVELRLRFAEAGELRLVPPVVPATGYYEDLVAPEEPTPTPTTPASEPTPAEGAGDTGPDGGATPAATAEQ